MALPSCPLVSVGGRRSQRPVPSPTLGSLGPSHHRRHKSRVSLRGPPCAHGVSGISLERCATLRYISSHPIPSTHTTSVNELSHIITINKVKINNNRPNSDLRELV